ncbi:MAG: hypothetical protein ACRDS9_05440 [Pseudonocardiaceae bacterium]
MRLPARPRRSRDDFDGMAYSTVADGIEKLVRHGCGIDTATQTAVDTLVSATDIARLLGTIWGAGGGR